MIIYDAILKYYFMSINYGWLQRDPFYAYSITKEE